MIEKQTVKGDLYDKTNRLIRICYLIYGRWIWVPFRPAIVYLSGIVEIVLALCLILPKTRYKVGRWVAIFLVLVFPVNIYMTLTPENYNLPAIALWFKLPLQLVLIWWVLVVTRKNYLDLDRKGINRHI